MDIIEILIISVVAIYDYYADKGIYFFSPIFLDIIYALYAAVDWQLTTQLNAHAIYIPYFFLLVSSILLI